MSRFYVVLIGVMLGAGVMWLCGCGGSGSADNPPVGQTGTLQGVLQASNATDYQILVDGQPLQIRCAADGSFVLPHLPAGSHTVSFVGRSGMAGVHIRVNIAPGKTSDIGSVTPSIGGQIAGLVTRREDDGSLTPLAGVEVIADPSAPEFIIMGQSSSRAARPRPAEQLVLRAITDERGSYVIPAVPEGAYVVTVNVPGLEQGVAYVWVSPGTTAVADFQLVPAVEPGVGTVQGHVCAQTENGVQPLEGALVEVFAERGWKPRPRPVPLPEPAPPHILNLVPPGATAIVPPPYVISRFATLTAADGSYCLNVPAGYLQMSVWAEGYEPAFDSFTLKAGEVITRDFTLQPGEAGPPIVIDGDQPVAGGTKKPR